MVTGIHHINFLVRDLDAAAKRYAALLGEHRFEFDELPKRGVKTAKVRLGETYLVLVQPLTEKGIPAEHLREHGEGFFLLSFSTDDLEQSLSKCQKAALASESKPRRGLDDWLVADLEPTAFFGAQLQLTQILGRTGASLLS